ncbi:ribonuclease P protein subunit p25b [Alosa alosa]|uniref:ribonuclease P protein subunit p25b n=1 Tax=Alosa alosa TaxID=278164 RepID=UPI002015149D|nr:ribonuclease P protein subunit p25b [Alosa alosa]
MIAGFSAINGHISGQCRVVGSGGLLAAPQVATQASREMGVTPDLCLHFQGQHFKGHPQSTCMAVGGIAACIKPALPPPPPALPPQPLSAPALPLSQSTPVPPAAPPKPGQGGFKKVCRMEEASPCPFPGLAAGVLHMRVKEGSKIRNLMGFAMARMQGPTGTETAPGLCGGTGSSASAGSAVSAAGSAGLRQVVFSGSGRAVTKTITCAEIMKRKLGGLHQLTKLCYKGVREVWESQEPAAAAACGSGAGNGTSSEMTVHRTVPSISILLSKDPLDPCEPGYQPPETLSALWGEREEQGGAPSQAVTKRAMLLEPLVQAGQPVAKRLCVRAAVPLCCPAD